MQMPDLYSSAKVAPQGKLNTDDLKKMGMNLLVFTAPVFAVFFAQLALEVEPKKAALIALVGFYGILADFFKKISDGRKV